MFLNKILLHFSLDHRYVIGTIVLKFTSMKSGKYIPPHLRAALAPPTSQGADVIDGEQPRQNF